MQSKQAESLARHTFGISGSATQLDGERDLNFKIDAGDACYILKVAPREEAAAIDAQNAVLTLLGEVPGVEIPALIPSIDGEMSDDHRRNVIRLLTWIDGNLMAPSDRSNAELLESLGVAVATLDRAMARITSPTILAAASAPFHWNVLHSQDIAYQAPAVSDPQLRAIVTDILGNGLANVLPALRKLPTQLIHNDANENNVVVRDGRVVGLIDFGDMIVAPKVCGLAVAVAYALMNSEDPVLDVLPVIRGYHRISPLSPAELELLFPLVNMRIATSIVMAAVQYKANPSNDYLLISQQHFASLIRVMHTASADLNHFRARATCGYDAVPTSRAVRQWLMSGKAHIADVVMPPLSRVHKVWFDWSPTGVDSPKTPSAIETAMVAAGARLAIGNYCEDRDVYRGDNYSVAGEQRRTVHLGVDLFAPAGTPVYAALDGTVALFNDNHAYLDYGPVIVLEHRTDDDIPFWTLYGHLSKPSLDPLFIGKSIKAGEQIATMGEEFENVGWAPHVHVQLLTSLCDMGVDVYGVAPRAELPIWRSISPNPNLLLRMPEGTDVHAPLAPQVLRAERSVVMSQALSLNFRTPLTIVRGRGAYLYDDSGIGFLDLVNNVAHVGHGHQRVVDAGARQMATLNTNTRYLNQHAIEYARSLAATLPDPLSVVFFTNSGSEANDLALRLAQAHTRARGVIALQHAYHGHLSSIIDISPYKFDGKGGRGRPDHVRVVPIPDAFKGIHTGPDSGSHYVQELLQAIEDLDQPLSAFICESIVSTAGQITLAPGFLSQAYAAIRAAGGVCIADEVQIGLGRMGSVFWGFELHGVVPDIVTMGKPLGNGHPLAAVVTTPDVAASFMTGMEYFNTFGGNPVSTAIGQSVLDVIADQALQANARDVGDYLMNSARSMQSDHEAIGDVRGSGLFIGIELVIPGTVQPATTLTADLIQYAKERGVLLSSDGPGDNVLKIKPPLVVTHKDIDVFLEVFNSGLASLS